MILVDPAYTSQICPVCGVVDAENRRTQAVFHCQPCGHEAHADVNAAQNIFAKGIQAIFTMESLDKAVDILLYLKDEV